MSAGANSLKDGHRTLKGVKGRPIWRPKNPSACADDLGCVSETRPATADASSGVPKSHPRAADDIFCSSEPRPRPSDAILGFPETHPPTADDF